HSGTQARQTAVLNTFTTYTVFADGVVGPGVGMSAAGNAALRPERTQELEGGFDVSFLDNERVHLEATMYRKISNDAISARTMPYSVGDGWSYSTNIGKVENRGVELTVAGKLLERRAVAWDLTVNATRNTNKLVSSANTRIGLTGFNCGNNFL